MQKWNKLYLLVFHSVCLSFFFFPVPCTEPNKWFSKWIFFLFAPRDVFYVVIDELLGGTLIVRLSGILVFRTEQMLSNISSFIYCWVVASQP